MRPTMWLKNDAGDVWNLKSNNLKDDYSSFFSAVEGTGFETKLKSNQVGYDFVVYESTPQQVAISGTMYFKSPLNMKRFEEFVGRYDSEVNLYYDPEGKIDPRDQLSSPWYKRVRVTKLQSGECDSKTGFMVCKMTFTPLSAMWKKDTTVISSISVSESEGHVYPFVYPYFYAADTRLYANILNSGEKIGCTIKIKNNSTNHLNNLSWTATSDNAVQYAKWMVGNFLEQGYTLIVDSNPTSQQSVISINNSTSDVQFYQEANPAYINFIQLNPGNNLIVFDLNGALTDVEIELSYTEQVRVL